MHASSSDGVFSHSNKIKNQKPNENSKLRNNNPKYQVTLPREITFLNIL